MAAPATPTGLAVDKLFSNAIKVSWNSSAGATGYELHISSDDITYVRATPSAHSDLNYVSFIDTAIQQYFKVLAFNGDGSSALSSSINGTTLAQVFKSVSIAGKKIYQEYDQNSYSREDDTLGTAGILITGFLRSLLAPVANNDVVRLVDAGTIYAPSSASYVVIALDGVLTAERRLQVGAGLSLVDAGANNDININIDNRLNQQAAEADLNQTITNPPTQAEVQAISDKIDNILAKLRSANVLST